MPLHFDRSRWQNWAQDPPITPERHYRFDADEPFTSVASSLSALVQEAESSGKRLRTVGSGWSFSDTAVDQRSVHPQWILETDTLNRRVHGVLPEAFRPEAAAALSRSPDGVTAYNYCHVEAGIHLHDLNSLLDALPEPIPSASFADSGPSPERLRGSWAVPTLGGSGGQTLAGAISTSTHGGDFANLDVPRIPPRPGAAPLPPPMPPVADAVAAIHLVGPGGVHHWIEPAGAGAITSEMPLKTAINAVYAVNIVAHYDDDLFRAALVSPGRFGIVLAYVLRVTRQFKLKETRNKVDWAAVVRVLGSSTGRRALPGFSGWQFLQIVIDPYLNSRGDWDCYVTRRVKTDEPLAPAPVLGRTLFSIVCDRTLATALILAAIAALGAIAALLVSTIFGAFLAIPIFVAIGVLSSYLLLGMDLGELVVRICNIAKRLGRGSLVVELLRLILDSFLGPTDTPTVDTGYKVMDTYDYSARCYSVHSLEFALDGDDPELTYWLRAEVLDYFSSLPDQNIVAGYVSLRFTGPTEALIGIQQWPLTCHVEVSLIKGIVGTDEVLRHIEQRARAKGAAIHWGQQNNQNRADVEAVYGRDARLARWRAALGSLATGDPMIKVFDSDFCQRRGLEVFVDSGGFTSVGVSGPLAAPDTTPCVLRNSDDRLEVFVIDSSGVVNAVMQADASSWGAWSALPISGVAATGNVAAANNADGHPEIFVRGVDGNIWHRWRSSAESADWSDWSNLGGDGGLTFDPCVTADAAGYLHLFAVDSSGQLRHRWQQTTIVLGWNDSGFQPLPALPAGATAVGSPAAVNYLDTLIVVVNARRSGPLWRIYGLRSTASGWEDWHIVGGESVAIGGDPALVVALEEGETVPRCYVRGGLGHLLHSASGPRGGWVSWEDQGGDIAPASTPGAVNSFVLARGSDSLCHVRDTPRSWRPLSPSISIRGSPRGGIGIDDRVYVFAVDDSGELVYSAI